MGKKTNPIKSRKTVIDQNKRLPSTLTDSIAIYINSRKEINPKLAYLQSEFMSKFRDDNASSDELRKTNAIEKWLRVEERNSLTNDRLRNTDTGYHILPRITYQKFMSKLQSIVSSIICDSPPLEALRGSFSGGSSTSRTRLISNPADKYVDIADHTASALDWFYLSLHEAPVFLNHVLSEHDPIVFREVNYNVLFTVPKNSLIDRVAAKEPDINMYLQKGVGSYIRQCLRKVGINLNDQLRNRSLAREGSISNKLATLDLSSASDTVTQELVFQALPITWYTLLNDLRCKYTSVDGEIHANEMFSSMGNGFTFELESLLFYSISRTVAYFERVSGVISVYGDDIIVPSEMYDSLTSVLSYLGFTVNRSKSFKDGPFRESCGGHYHNGHDITPFYIREEIRTMVQLTNLVNKIRQWSIVPGLTVLDDTLESLWFDLVSFLPKSIGGGKDYGSREQIVSPHLPYKRFVPLVKKSEHYHIGSYLHSLNAISDRTNSITSSRSSTNKNLQLEKFTLQRVRFRNSTSFVHPLFIRECD